MHIPMPVSCALQEWKSRDKTRYPALALADASARCPEHAISVVGNSDKELFARIDALTKNRNNVIAFLDENIALCGGG